MKRVYYSKPSITQKEIDFVKDAATNGWGEHCYDYIHRFERQFSQYSRTPYALATSSCTGALHLGLAALGIGPGDEVILADINWIASAAPITYLGAKPVFVDILPDSWCIDPERAAEAITERTKAILAVHLYGNLCDMTRLENLSLEHGIALVEDAAEAMGSSWLERPAGSIGSFGVFSFHGTKTITTGEGGMLVTHKQDFYERVAQLNNHGRNSRQHRQFWPEEIGYKYKISNVDAALGCAQLERLSELLSAKRSIFMEYKKRLAHLPLKLNPEPPGTTNGFWMPTAVVDNAVPFNRQILLDNFRRANIDGRVFFWPLSSLPMFRRTNLTPVSYSIHSRAFNLPSYHDMSTEDIALVCEVVSDACK